MVFAVEGDDLDPNIEDPIALPAQPNELTKRVLALEEKVEAVSKALETNTKVLESTTQEVSRLAALLEVFIQAKEKDMAAQFIFPITDDESLAALELTLCPANSDSCIFTVSNLLKENVLTKSLKLVLGEELCYTYNLDGINGKKRLKAFPRFFSILIESISTLGEASQSPEKALAHAMYCVKNNLYKKKRRKFEMDENY